MKKEWSHGPVRIAINADLFGRFAVHQAVGDADKWVATHVDTGMKVSEDVSRAKVKFFAERFHRSGLFTAARLKPDFEVKGFGNKRAEKARKLRDELNAEWAAKNPQ
jgi:hypothetical protein